MDKLILFRAQLQSLQQKEYQQLVNSQGREFIETLIFKGLLQELSNNKMHNIDKMNENISQIKQLRKQNSSNNINNQREVGEDESIPLTLEILPNVLLSNISSFLAFVDQLQFEKCSRQILIGSRSSTTSIYSLNAKYFSKLIIFHNNNKTYLPKLRSYKSITINCKDMFHLNTLKYKLNHLKIFRKVKELCIEYKQNSHLRTILLHLHNGVNLSKIETLRWINHWRGRISRETITTIEPIFANMSQLKYFEYVGTERSDDIAFSNNKWIKNLKGISIAPIAKNLFTEVSTNLQSFHGVTKAKLNDLKEICLKFKEILCVSNINYMKSIERIHFRDVCVDRSDRQLAQQCLNKLIKSLNYIGLDACGPVESLDLDLLMTAIGTVKKHQFKMRINECEFMQRSIDDTCIRLKKFIDVLNLNCKNWMLIYGGGCDVDFDYLNKITDEMKLLSWTDIMNQIYTEMIYDSGGGCPVHDMDSIYYDVSGNQIQMMCGLCNDAVVERRNIYNDKMKYKMGKLDDFVKLLQKTYVVNVYRHYFVATNKGDCNINGYNENWIMQCDKCRQNAIC
eukprot:168582_1